MTGLTRNWQELVRYVFKKRCHRVGRLLPVESRTSSSSQLYVCDSDVEAQVNARCCSMDGLDRDIVATI